MIYLYDTNVVSETAKKSPHEKLVNFLWKINIKEAAISVLTLGEIRKGIEKLNDEQKKQQIINWLEKDIIGKFEGRIINIDQAVADKWGYIVSSYNIPPIDGLIGASCLVHNLRLVTRNVRDFSKVPGLEIVNPWE